MPSEIRIISRNKSKSEQMFGKYIALQMQIVYIKNKQTFDKRERRAYTYEEFGKYKTVYQRNAGQAG